MDTYQIIVTSEDYEGYTTRVYYHNKINLFWKRIFKSMPSHLKQECMQKRTDLIVEENSDKVLVCKFKTNSASKELDEYLCRCEIIVDQTCGQ